MCIDACCIYTYVCPLRTHTGASRTNQGFSPKSTQQRDGRYKEGASTAGSKTKKITLTGTDEEVYSNRTFKREREGGKGGNLWIHLAPWREILNLIRIITIFTNIKNLLKQNHSPY